MRRCLVHDVFVKEYHMHQMVRQFGLRRQVPVLWGELLPPNVHKYTRKGVSGRTSWAEKLAPWIVQWLHALEDVVQEDAPYNHQTYEEYNEWYSTRKRVRCIRVMDDPPRHEAATTNTYPSNRTSHSIARSTRTWDKITWSHPLRCSDQVVHPFGTRSWYRTREHKPGTTTSTTSGRYGERAVGLRTVRALLAKSPLGLHSCTVHPERPSQRRPLSRHSCMLFAAVVYLDCQSF